MWWTNRFFVLCSLLASSSTSTAQFAGDTCFIKGQLFQRGESVGELWETRCGVPADFPCYCNPDLKYQVECPYCGLATSTPNYVRCAKHEEVVSFIDLEGRGQSCICDASDPAEPTSNCVDNSSAEICNIVLESGEVVVRFPGQEIGVESRCGSTSDYPCTCNPNFPGQIECPYCSFPTRLADGTPDLVCLADAESKTIKGLDNITRICSCEEPDSLAFPHIATCDGAQTQTPVDEGAQCVFMDDVGVEFKVDHGAVLDHHFDNRCGEDWPCFCNTLLLNQIECPYCAVPLENSDLFLCGADNDVLDIPQDDGTTYGCQCQILNAFTQPAIVCGNFPTSTPKGKCVVDQPNGQQLEVEAGEPLESPESPCNADFPYICNPDLDNNLEFPYCQVEWQGGGISCAKGGANVTFTNVQGKKETCACTYVNATLGPQKYCVVAPDAPDAPTPTPSSEPSAGGNPPVVVVQGTSGVMKRSIGSAIFFGALVVVWEIMEM